MEQWLSIMDPNRTAHDALLFQQVRRTLDKTSRLEMETKLIQEPQARFWDYWEDLKDKFEGELEWFNRQAWARVKLQLDQGQLTCEGWRAYQARYLKAAMPVLDRTPQEERTKILLQLPDEWRQKVINEESRRRGRQLWVRVHHSRLKVEDLQEFLRDAWNVGAEVMICLADTRGTYDVKCPTVETHRRLKAADGHKMGGLIVRVSNHRPKMSTEDIFEFVLLRLKDLEEGRYREEAPVDYRGHHHHGGDRWNRGHVREVQGQHGRHTPSPSGSSNRGNSSSSSGDSDDSWETVSPRHKHRQDGSRRGPRGQSAPPPQSKGRGPPHPKGAHPPRPPTRADSGAMTYAVTKPPQAAPPIASTPAPRGGPLPPAPFASRGGGWRCGTGRRPVGPRDPPAPFANRRMGLRSTTPRTGAGMSLGDPQCHTGHHPGRRRAPCEAPRRHSDRPEAPPRHPPRGRSPEPNPPPPQGKGKGGKGGGRASRGVRDSMGRALAKSQNPNWPATPQPKRQVRGAHANECGMRPHGSPRERRPPTGTVQSRHGCAIFGAWSPNAL